MNTRILTAIGLLMLTGSSALAAKTTSSSKSNTIDLGQLEIQGELRRPPVNWIGNYKGMREILPVLYSVEFADLEKEILESSEGNASLRGVTLSKPEATVAPKKGGKKK